MDPSPQTKVTIVGKCKSYRWRNLVGPFGVHYLLGHEAPPPPHPLYHMCCCLSDSLAVSDCLTRRSWT